MNDEVAGLTNDDVQAASMAVADFWTSLADDDDALLMAATSSATHGEIDTAPGMCGRLREALGVTQEVAARVGTSSKVRVVDKGVPIFLCLEVSPEDEPKVVGTWGPERFTGWALWATIERGRWVVGGRYTMDPNGWPTSTRYLDLPHAPPPPGPVQ